MLDTQKVCRVEKIKQLQQNNDDKYQTHLSQEQLWDFDSQ